MQKLIYALLLLICVSTACNKDDFSNAVPCSEFRYNDLHLQVQEEFTTLPGKISIFFRVEDKAGESISGLEASNFTIYEKGRNDECFREISSNESFAAINSRSQIFSFNTVLVLDLSGSVITNSLTELKSAAKSFIDNVMQNAQTESYNMGIWWFDGENELHPLTGFESDPKVLKAKIDGLQPGLSIDPSTDLYGAVIKSANIATQKLDEFVAQDIISAASVVIFTDGTDQAARFTEQQAMDAVQSADKNISFYTIGLGDEIDHKVLQALGKTGSIFAENKEELEAKFAEAADEIWKDANSFYLFEYCTPKRDGSGTNELVIVADDGKRKGFLETTFDATGFSSGCTTTP